MEKILEPWPWFVSGPLIALIMALLLLVGKHFGMSSNLRTLCTISGAGKFADFFRFDWKAQRWNLIVAIGAVVGGFVAVNFLTADTSVAINQDTIAALQKLGIVDGGDAYMPALLFGQEAFLNLKTLLLLLLGGFLVGFGARYAGGCTSGHAISGLSNLQLPSLIAVVGFFVGGLVMVHFIFPLIFG
ncbi:YeeE/YedE family protein [uncultured Croceitalea sp.]|uniref:YeeE/YedE family protein n=1 Tax=uncultured Croceitalea sp. TaxID=1798908 RepID=UPI00374ECED0